MSGELRPTLSFEVGQEVVGIWHHDRLPRRGAPAMAPERWSRKTFRVAKIGRKYVYFEYGDWYAQERREICSTSRDIGGYDIDWPELDAYEARVADAHAVLKAHGFAGSEYDLRGPRDADLFAVADLLRHRDDLR